MEKAYPLGHTLVPVNIGSSVMGLKYNGGVMLAADTAISYGSMHKTKHGSRIAQLSDEAAFTCSGEMSDF
jgi:20S proteasome subunit beta 7